MPITDYSLFIEKGVEGQIGSAADIYVRGSHEQAFNNSTALIPFGRIVVAKDADNLGEVTLPDATGQKVLGITHEYQVYEKDENNLGGVPAGREISYLLRGIVYCLVEVAVVPSDPVFFRHTAAGVPGPFDAIGRLRIDADTATADAISGVKFLRSGAAGDIVPVRFDLTI